MSLYRGMVQVREMDKILYEVQRQGLISFYMTSTGEEAYLFFSSSISFCFSFSLPSPSPSPSPNPSPSRSLTVFINQNCVRNSAGVDGGGHGVWRLS